MLPYLAYVVKDQPPIPTMTRYKDIHVQGYTGNILEYTGIHRNILEYTRTHRNIQEYTGIHTNILEYTGIHTNILGYTGIYRNLHEYIVIPPSIQFHNFVADSFHED